MSKEVVLSKADVRQVVRQRILRLSEDEYQEGSSLICRKIEESDAWQQASAVCLYYPLGREPDVRPLFQVARQSHKELLLPRFNESEGVYKPVIVHDPDQDLKPGRYGIMEPKGQGHVGVIRVPCDFILVPGVAFSLNGSRVGRGGGYFDRLLARIDARKCGVAFDCQILSEIPSESHDIHMNFMVTPEGFLKCLV